MNAPNQKKQVKLTFRQEKFVQSYIELGNGKLAVEKAGYTSKHSDRLAHCLLKMPHIKTIIEKNRAEMQERHKIDRQWITEQHMRFIDGSDKDLAFKSLQELSKIHGLYAPAETVNKNETTIKASVEEVKEAREKYKSEF